MAGLLIISGGSRGLGNSLVTLCESRGFEVIDFSRKGSVPCDFSRPEEAASVIEQTLLSLTGREYEEIIVINNAATLTPIGPLMNYSPQEWLININVNLNSAITLSGLFFKHFQKRDVKKTLVNISSGAAKRGMAGWSLYCAAKAGMDNLSSALAAEQALEEYPALVIAFDPGIMDTGMQAEIRSSDKSQFPYVEDFKTYKDDGKLRSPDFVAGLLMKVLDAGAEQGRRYSVKEMV